MKVIVAGSRDITDYAVVCEAIETACAKVVIDEIVSGGARGVDELGERYAREHGIPLKVFPADWKQFGLGAGPRRNRQMAEYADALVAVWNGGSPGTRNMIETAKELGLKVFVRRLA